MAATRRRRLSPQQRHDELLDIAATVIVEEGMNALTMDRLAAAAQVSIGTPYVYFANRAELLLALYQREEAMGDARSAQHARNSVDFHDEVRTTTASYIDTVEQRGVLYVRLFQEPSLEDQVEHRRRSAHRSRVQYWTGRAVESGLTPDRAEVFATMFMGAAESTWELIHRRAVPRPLLEETYLAALFAAHAELLRLSEEDRRFTHP